ncbi:MAG: SRPBCC domain-containing protein [Acholeplasmataceae bacterium]|nr:SRPBCC domain-containing protein [Acholeplasmataceae bacterium]
MEYQVDIEIQKPANECFKAYTEVDIIMKWLPNLLSIKNTKGKLFTESSEGYFVFDQHGHEMIMEIEVVEVKSPYQITMIYRVPGAKNTCINQFKELNHHTHWVMNVIFEFEEDPNLDIEIFKKSTLMSMEIFKKHMEESHHD